MLAASASCVTQDPAAAAPEEGQRVAVDERRPQRLQQVRQRHVRHDADGGVGRPGVLQPRLQRALGDLVGEPGGGPEHQDGEHLRAGEYLARS